MTLRSLGEGLRDLADAVEPVDLRDRALTASRRLRARRVVAGMGTAALCLFALVLGVSAMLPGGSPPPPRDLAGGAAEPSSSSSFDENYMGPADTLAGGYSLDSGSFYYLAAAKKTGTVELLRWTSGQAATTVVADAIPATGTEQLSPDGRYLSSVEDGAVQLRDLIAGTRRQSVKVAAQRCNIPTWAPDGERLLVQTGPEDTSGPMGFVSTIDAGYTEFGDGGGCHTHPSFGRNGDIELTYTAYGPGTQSIVRGTLDGAVTSSVAWDSLPGGMRLDQVSSVSPDGSLVCVGLVPSTAGAGDLGSTHNRSCQAVGVWADGFRRIDVSEPFSEALMLQGAFVTRTATNGGGSTLRLHDISGAEVSRLTEPELPEGSVLLGFVPA